MDKDRFNDFDEEDRQLVLDFENTVLRGGTQFFDVDELEVIIDYYLEVGDMAPLVQAVDYAEQLYPNSTSVHLRRAHLLIAQEQYNKAMAILLDLRRREPNNTDVAYSLGVAYGAMGEHEKAVAHYLEAAEDGWLLGRIYANIAEEYYHMDDFAEAIRFYQLALDTDSYDDATLYNYLDTAIQADRVDDTVEYLKSFVDEHPYDSVGWHVLGNAYREHGLYEKAIDAYEYAIAIDKNNTSCYFDLSLAYEAKGQIGEAVSSLLRARDLTNHRSALFRQVALVYTRSGNAELALLYYRKAVEEDPDDVEALASLALGCYMAGEVDQARGYIKKALLMAPDNAEVLFSAGGISEMECNNDMAGEYYERAIASDGCTETMCRCYTQFLYKSGNYEILIDFALESLEIYHDDPFYSTFLAAAYFHTNRYNRASRMLPNVDTPLLRIICPEIFENPRLSAIIPPEESV